MTLASRAGQIARLGGALLVSAALAGCMGTMFGGSPAGPSPEAQFANASATPAEMEAVRSSALSILATECPPIRVRPGSEALFSYGRGQVGNPRDLDFQVIIDDVSRNCEVSNGLITVRMGMAGRVLLGPANTQSRVDVGVRFAIERDGQAVFSERYTETVTVTPPAQSQEFVRVVENVAIPYLGGESITIWVGFDNR